MDVEGCGLAGTRRPAVQLDRPPHAGAVLPRTGMLEQFETLRGLF